MNSFDKIAPTVHLIQIAIVPFFLLASIGSLLLVSRLVHANQRYTELKRLILHELKVTGQEDTVRLKKMSNFAKRVHLVSTAISLCVVCDLLVCVIIATLFVGSTLSVSVATLVLILFIASTLALVLAILSFLREVLLASKDNPQHSW